MWRTYKAPRYTNVGEKGTRIGKITTWNRCQWYYTPTALTPFSTCPDISVRVAARHADPSEEAVGDQPWWSCKRNIWLDGRYKEQPQMKERGSGSALGIHPSPVMHLNNTNTTSDLQRCTIISQNSSHVHRSVHVASPARSIKLNVMYIL